VRGYPSERQELLLPFRSRWCSAMAEGTNPLLQLSNQWIPFLVTFCSINYTVSCLVVFFFFKFLVNFCRCGHAEAWGCPPYSNKRYSSSYKVSKLFFKISNLVGPSRS
jgi:hypothetical protein